jgi:hypothetical protein
LHIRILASTNPGPAAFHVLWQPRLTMILC